MLKDLKLNLYLEEEEEKRNRNEKKRIEEKKNAHEANRSQADMKRRASYMYIPLAAGVLSQADLAN